MAREFHIIHPAWIQDFIKVHCPETAHAVRRVKPGLNGAPTMTHAEEKLGCVVIAYEKRQ